MSKIIISDETYEELIGYMEKNGIKNCNVRISIAGGRCSGPAFQITASEVQASDAALKIKDINFIIGQALLDECGGFEILSSKENYGKGLSIKPLNKIRTDCASCGRGCP